MISKIKIFIQNLQQNTHLNPHQKDPVSIEVATAVLLFEVIKADQLVSVDEQAQMISILHNQFSLTLDEIHEIIKIAESESLHANDFYKYTSLLNKQLPLTERIYIVELLWQLAYADKHVDAIEEHIIRRIADLLHLRHEEYIQCKLKVQQHLDK